MAFGTYVQNTADYTGSKRRNSFLWITKLRLNTLVCYSTTMKLFTSSGKCIGNYNEKKNTLTKFVKRSRHLFKSLNAWGIDGDAFAVHLEPQNATIVIKETEEKKTYSATAEEIKKHGRWMSFGDHGPQIFLPLEYWIVK